MNYRLKKLCICILSAVWLAAGCGKDETLTAYEEQMTVFFDNISELNANMNAVDVSDEAGAQNELLGCLDTLEAEFNRLAEAEVPDDFSSVESLANEAAENMTQAVALYHQLYEGEQYDAALANAANEYYSRANIRLQYIISILHGEIPEGENVTVTMDSDLNIKSETEESIQEGF